VQTSECVTTLGAAITKRGGPIALARRVQSRRSTLLTDCRHGGTVTTCPSPRQSASVMRDLVAAGREILVGGVLILVCRPLIAVTGGLVVIRPRLILITRGLVVIRPRLSAVTLAPATFGSGTSKAFAHVIRRELGAAGWTTGNPDRVTAGRTSHKLGHLLPSLAGRAGKRGRPSPLRRASSECDACN